jgi:DNA-binding beta-propeller fold protein YncE
VLNNSTPVQTLRRLDPGTGQMLATRRGTHINGPAVILAGRLWVVSFGRHGDQLQALDLHTLATTASIDLTDAKRAQDAVIAGAATRSARIYLVYHRNHVAVINATRQRVMHRYTIPGGAVQAAVDPTGTRMYVVTTATRDDTQTQALTVRDPDTGAVLLTSDYHSELGPGSMGVVAASLGGVWISEGSGMEYSATFHARDDLDTTTAATGSAGGGYPVTVTVDPHVAWLGSTTNIICANPTTGAVRAAAPVPALRHREANIADFTVAGGRLFADFRQPRSQLISLNPPPRCSR